MTEQESLQNEFNNIHDSLKEISRIINMKGYTIHNNKVIKRVQHYYVYIETAYFGNYYHDDYKLKVSTKAYPISEEDMSLFIYRLNGINSLDSFKEVNDSYYLISEEYYYLSEQPLSLFYKKSETEFELSGINISSENAKSHQLKYCNIKFLSQEHLFKKINKEIEMENGDNYIYPSFYVKDNINILLNFKQS